MAKLAMKAAIRAPAEDVWRTIRDFGALGEYLPGISDCVVQGPPAGATRSFSVGGGRIVERLERLDDASRTLVYSIVQSGLPLAEYLSTMRLRELPGDRCELAWSCAFKPMGAPEAEVKKLIEGVYTAGIAGLKKLHGGD